MSDAPDEQLSLPGIAKAKARAAKRPAEQSTALAATDPVARVLVDVPLAHLDRPFDYAVPDKYAETAVAGARVKVRFAGQDVDGFVLARVAESDHPGRLMPLRRVVSAEPVLTPEIAALSDAVAKRYAGTRSDVLRLAVPARHATAEKAESAPAADVTAEPRARTWGTYPDGPAYLDALAAGESPRAVLTVAPGDDPAALLAEAVVATARSGRGALVCVPDQRDLARLDAALTVRLGKDAHVVLSADAGPQKRYTAFLRVVRGSSRLVIGTRAAAFAPVHDLGLVAIWDDGDDLYDEPRAPYPHTREVLLLRAQETGCAVLLGSHARSVEAQYLVRTGWASEIVASRETLRRRATVAVTGGSDLALDRDPRARTDRLPHEAFETIREALTSGPVLVQTPRSGYATRLACDHCRHPATCTVCHGPLRISGPGQPPACAWCATPSGDWSCPECGGRGLRAPVLGDRRTAEELGRAFPNVTVRSSGGDTVLAEVPAGPALVVATPGAEPVARAGYAAVLLLDTWLPLARSDLRAAEEAVRRWANAAALLGPEGGRVLLVGDPAQAAVQAMVRWDPAGFAEREIVERQSAHLPPASRMATLTGPQSELEPALEGLALPPGAEVLGPVPTENDEAVRYVVRVPRAAGEQLSAVLRELQAVRAAHKQPHLRVEVDPAELG